MLDPRDSWVKNSKKKKIEIHIYPDLTVTLPGISYKYFADEQNGICIKSLVVELFLLGKKKVDTTNFLMGSE